MALFKNNEATLVERLKRILASPKGETALAALVRLEADCAVLPKSDATTPPSLWCVVLSALAHQLLETERGADILPMLKNASDRFVPQNPYYVPGSNLGRLMSQAPFLSVPLILGGLRAGESEDAMMQLQVYAKQSDLGRKAWIPSSEAVGTLLKDATIAPVAKLDMGADWLLDRQSETRAMLERPDFTRERFVEFDETLLETAIATDRFADVKAVVNEHLATGDRLECLPDTHLGFNAFCVLAALDRHDEAITLATRMIRHGYRQSWRFGPDAGERHAWVVKMGQDKCIADLVRTPAYTEFRERCLKARILSRDDPEQALLADIYDGVWSGKKPIRCKLTKSRIQPEGNVVRLRRLFDYHGVGDIEIADAHAFRASGWQSVRDQFETNGLPLSALFPGRARQERHVRSPKIAALMADIAAAPENLNFDTIVSIIAAQAPRPRRFEWKTGPKRDDREPAFDPFAQDRDQGEVVRLIWRLWKGGQMPSLLTSITTLPDAQADRLMALIACFDDAQLRCAAADHFGLPDLPDMMARAFESRQDLKQHRQLADFGRDNPRFRAGLVASMAADGLHLFSNYAPTVDWYLNGLTQFNLAKGSQLLWFLIHTPQDDPVLAQMLEKSWLPTGIGTHDAYENTAHHYYRAAALHLGFNDPQGFQEWQQIDWMKSGLTMAIDRKTFSLLKQVSKNLA